MSKLPDFEALAIFAKVVEMRSFAGAAGELALSKATVSKAVTRLERRLGARLFNRTSRQIALTDAGQKLAARAARLLSDGEAAENEALAQSAVPRGLVRLAVPMSYGIKAVAPLLPEFLAAYPEVSIDLHLGDAMVDLVGEGFDAAVRIGSLTDSSLVARRLAGIRRVLCASPDYLARHGVPQTPDDLKSHDCLSNTNITITREWRFIRPDDGAPWPVEVKGRMIANSGDLLRVAALHGHGFVHLPTFIVGEDLRAGTLVSVLEPYVAQDLTLNAVYPTARHLSPKVRAFVDFLAERFGGDKPYWDAA